MKIYHFLILGIVTAGMLAGCKGDKKTDPVGNVILTLDTDTMKLEGDEFFAAPTEDESENFITVNEGQISAINAEGADATNVKWTIGSTEAGEGPSIQYTWTGSGIQEITATMPDGTQKTAYVKVVPASGPGVPAPGPSTDTDGDGVPDDQDYCKESWGLKKFKGCPDSDEDGIPNIDDDCPNAHGPKPSGCPPTPPGDADGDGVPDNRDKCKTTYGSMPDGCPPPDSDGDGVPDDRDKCKTTYGSMPDGCPPSDPDSDGDGIPDKEDKCPSQKGTREYGGCEPPPPPTNKAFVAGSTATTCKVTSLAALDDEKEMTQSGVIKIKPSKDLILYEAQIISNGHGKIEITLQGDDIKREITLLKSVNPGSVTLRFNDFKNNVLRAGKNYTLSYTGQEDVRITVIKSAYISGCSDENISISGKSIFYNLKYKY